jgi:hypothetical protein
MDSRAPNSLAIAYVLPPSALPAQHRGAHGISLSTIKIPKLDG